MPGRPRAWVPDMTHSIAARSPATNPAVSSIPKSGKASWGPGAETAQREGPAERRQLPLAAADRTQRHVLVDAVVGVERGHPLRVVRRPPGRPLLEQQFASDGQHGIASLRARNV